MSALKHQDRRGGGGRTAARRLVRFGPASLLVLATAVSTIASADVLEIGGDGGVTVRHGRIVADAADPTAAAADGDDGIAGNLVSAADAHPAVPDQYAVPLAHIAAETRLSPALIEAVVWQESRWHADAVSRAGARGLAQLMPATARSLGVDPADPVANLRAGARYLRLLVDRYDGDIERALAAYNAGPARVERAGGIPPIAETRAYVSAIAHRLSSSVQQGQ